ncbi:hypothetical protein AB0B28_08155 [Glycomyces sp. NPDC046736]|uniref:hypothetical protein n=1 Tax=Glycomyces sp. NPDC046736 TaxID=3155615 RepID=UPI0033DC436B
MPQPVYATPEEYAEWLAAGGTPSAPPAGAQRALRAASGRIDELLTTAYYETDADGRPVKADVVEALMEATCAQADYQRAIGDRNSTGAQQFASAKIGTASVTRGQATGGGTKTASPYSAEAASILRRAGLIPGEPWTSR